MSDLVRYSLIKDKFPREFLLLQGSGCRYKKCRFCDYYKDVSENPFEVNLPILNKITGIPGVLDIINSGSCFELDDSSLQLIYNIALKKNINTIWFESHYMYKNNISEFRKKFDGVNLKFRTGIESFNPKIRQFLNKGVPKNVGVDELSKIFNGVCLLIGFLGQTREDIINDISLAHKYFEYASINVFVENSSSIKKDEKLISWFVEHVYPQIKDLSNIEVLLKNTDLGVG